MRWKEALKIQIEELQKIQSYFEKNEKDVLKIINFVKFSNVLFMTGVGKNKDLMNKMCNTYNSLSIKSILIDPVSAMHGDMGLINNGANIIATSKSGTTKELSNFLDAVKKYRSDTKVLLLHCNENYVKKSYVDDAIYIPVENEVDHLNIIPTASLICMEVILYAAACQIIQDNNFSKKDLFLNHPAGNIGEICGK